jgi:predicted metal-dependent HD superfamily phosphohydrolase
MSLSLPFDLRMLYCIIQTNKELKQEVNHLQSLLNIEQSIHNHLQSSSSLSEVEVEAAVEELVRTTTSSSSSSSSSSKTDDKVDTVTDTATKEELKDLLLLTQEYEQTMKRALELKEEVEEYDMGSGIK